MNAIQLLHEIYKRGRQVQLRPLKHLRTDLRNPRDAHRLARKFECRKVLP